MSDLSDFAINGTFANFYSNKDPLQNSDRTAGGRIPNRFTDINKVSEANARFIHDMAEQVIEDNLDNGSDSHRVLRKAATTAKFDKDGSILLRLTESDDTRAAYINTHAESDSTSAEELRKKRHELITKLVNSAAKHQQQATKLSQAMDKAVGQLQVAISELDTATGLLEDNTAIFNDLKQQLIPLQSKLSALSREGVNEDDPRYIALNETIIQTKNTLNTASQTVAKAEAEVTSKLNMSQALLIQHGDLIRQLTTMSTNKGGVVVIHLEQLITEEKKSLSFAADLSRRMAEILSIFSKNSLDKLKNDQQLIEIRMEAMRTGLAEKARQFDEQQKKAVEAAEKMSKCTKIFGGIATALGALTMVFGGAGAPLMALGLGLLVADTISEKLFGFSITEKVMGPLMDHVFMPLMNAIKDVVSDIFDHTPIGAILNAIDKATGANMMGTIHTAVAAAATVAVIVAAAFILKSAANVLYKSFAKSLTQAVVSYVKTAIKSALKQMPKLLKNAGKVMKEFAQQTKQLLDDFATKAMEKLHLSSVTTLKAARVANIAAEVVTLSDVTNKMAHSIIIGVHNKQAQDALAEYQICRELMDLLTKKLDDLLDMLKKDNAEIKARGDKISELIQSSHQAKISIIRAM